MAGQHPDPTPGMNPDDIARTTFAMGRKGYDPIEVKSFLVSVSNELRVTRSQVLELEQELRAAQQDADRNREVDPSRLTALLGEETARVLDAAREVADDMRAKAEEGTARLLREATDDANRMRQEASEVLTRKTAEANTQADQIRRQAADVLTQAKADAATEVEAGRQEGREMVAEAQKVRERMLNDLARRRKAFRQQIERLQAGRDRLLAAYDVVRETLDVATDELQVALPEARLAAESASLRAGDEDVATLEELEQEAASLPESTTTDSGDHEADAHEHDDAEHEADGSAATVDDATTEGPDAGPDEPTAAEPAEAEPDAGAEPAAPVDDELVEEPGDAAAHDPGPRAPSAPDLEGRRSSSVNVIRSESDPEPDSDAEPEEGPDADAETEPEAGADAPAAAEVSSLFARIRSESEIAADEKAAADQAAAEAASAAEVVEIETIELVEEIVVVDGEVVADAISVEVTDVVVAAEPEPVEIGIDAQVIARRDAALADTERALSRRIKRELSDEQNELLDTVRRQKGKPTAAQALPEADEHRSRYATAALPSLVSAAAAGADLIVGLTEEVASKSGAPKTRGGDLAAELAADLVEGLRDRIERCFAEAGGDEEELAERLRACYREWKGQRVDELASRYVLAACNRGLLDSLAEGTLVHWVVDDGDTPSPDCDDNALAGDVHKGDKFPTGHLAPPISLTCRCIVLPAL